MAWLSFTELDKAVVHVIRVSINYPSEKMVASTNVEPARKGR